MTETDRVGFPLKPRQLRKNGGDAWFYETPKGIEVVSELRKDGIYLGTTITTVPWPRAHDAVENYWKVQKRKRPRRAAGE